MLFRMGDLVKTSSYLPNGAAMVLSCLAMVSCGQIPMEDYSSAPEYSSVLGKTFRTKQDLWAIGITTDRDYKKQVDFIALVPGVGFSGPEVVTKERFNKGSVIRIAGVLKARSYLTSRVEYVVEEVDSSKFKGAAIRVVQTGRVNDKNFGLDESIYEKLNSP